MGWSHETAPTVRPAGDVNIGRDRGDMAQGNCDDALHVLYDYLDDELTDENRKKIQHHLDDCPPCYEAFDFEAELRIVIAKKCVETVPEDLRRRVAESLEREREASGAADA
jgi:mycothiol system anti-sigma-R factor